MEAPTAGLAAATAVLITGNPGSGKTAMVAELTRLGYAAVDTDDEVAGWASARDGRRWVWDRTRLEQVIRRHAPDGGLVFMCGIAMNQRDVLDVFKQVFLLSLDQETQISRLAASDDRDAASRERILEGLPVFEREMTAAGAAVLDGRLPTSVLAAHILGSVT